MAPPPIEHLLRGSLALSGLLEPVSVSFDAFLVPQIEAQNEDDAWQALGLLHAACRPFHLELSRRTWSGRLSAMFGDPPIRWPLEPVRFKGAPLRVLDRYLRNLGLVESAARQAAQLGDEAPRVEAYTRGVQAGFELLARHGGFEEARLLKLQPEPWSVTDSCLVLLGHAWALSEGPGPTLSNLQILRHLPTDDPRRASFLPAGSALDKVAASLAEIDAAVQRLVGMDSPGRGSNACVLPGHRSRSGKPLLACDLHQAPGISGPYFLASLRAPGMQLDGFTLPGLPGVWAGSNGSLAWGPTRAAIGDSQLCLERFDPEDAGRVQTAEGWTELECHDEILEIQGKPDFGFRRRRTPNGPLLSDLDLDGLPSSLGLSMRWAGFDAEAPLRALLRLNRASDGKGLCDALSELEVPALHVAWAASDGSCGSQLSGWLLEPRTALPGPGWEPGRRRPAAEVAGLPRVGPEEPGLWVLANQQLERLDGESGALSLFPSPGYRAQRMHELLDGSEPLGPNALCAVQTDVVSLFARELQQLVLKPWLERRGEDLHEKVRAELEKLTEWEADCGRLSRSASIFHLFVLHLLSSLLGEDAELEERVLSDPGRWRTVLLAALRCEAGWLEPRVLDHRLLACFEDALTELHAGNEKQRKVLSAGEPVHDPGAWGWLHSLQLRHSLDPRGQRWQVPRLPMPGSWFTLNPGDFSPADPCEPKLVACARLVIDMAAPQQARFALAGGQCADPRSSHLCDLLHQWAEGSYLRLERSEGFQAWQKLQLLP